MSFEGVTKDIKDERQPMGKEKRRSKMGGGNMGYKKIQVLQNRHLVNYYYLWAWRPSWLCDPDPANKLRSLIPLRLHMKFGFD